MYEYDQKKQEKIEEELKKKREREEEDVKQLNFSKLYDKKISYNPQENFLER